LKRTINAIGAKGVIKWYISTPIHCYSEVYYMEHIWISTGINKSRPQLVHAP
jgi:hypothetical protein